MGGPGQSRVGNYGPLVTFHHRLSTRGGWQVCQPFDGLYVWRDPHGATDVVDASGTRRLPPVRGARPADVASGHVPSGLAA